MCLSDDSVSYPFVFEFGDQKVMKGSNIYLTIDLVGGSTFKIIGLMVCNNT